MLAGYMLIVNDALCDALPMLNLHPALPDGPIGAWQEVIRQLIADNASESGMMLQRVTTQLDRGPVVTFCRYPIRGALLDPLWAAHDPTQPVVGSPLFAAIRAEGVARESIFIIESLAAIAGGRISVPSPDDDERLAYDLSADVERALRTANPDASATSI